MSEQEMLKEALEWQEHMRNLITATDDELYHKRSKVFDWLLERVQELESKLNKQIEIGYKFEGEVYDLAKENKRYREALNSIIAMLFRTGDEVYDAIQDAIKVLEEIE